MRCLGLGPGQPVGPRSRDTLLKDGPKPPFGHLDPGEVMGQERHAKPRDRRLDHHRELIDDHPFRSGHRAALTGEPILPARGPVLQPQERNARHVVGCPDRMTIEEGRRRTGREPLVKQLVMMNTRPVGFAEIDDGIENLGLETEPLDPGRQVHRNPGMRLEEPAEPRAEPARREGRQYRERDRAPARIGHHRHRGPLDHVERALDICLIGQCRLRRDQPPPLSGKEFCAQLLFQGLGQPADG